MNLGQFSVFSSFTNSKPCQPKGLGIHTYRQPGQAAKDCCSEAAVKQKMLKC